MGAARRRQHALHRMTLTHLLRLAAASAALLAGPPLLAADTTTPDPLQQLADRAEAATGLEFWGYARGGLYSGAERQGRLRGNYSLGGDLHKYRLGNEGDNFIEFGLGKRFALGQGLRAGLFYMPKMYNGDPGTAQAYATLDGLFGSQATLWAGQRYHRILDVHIVDHWVMEDGDNFGLGVDDLALGALGTLNLALHTAGNLDEGRHNPNDARRLNLQWRRIPLPQAGASLTLTGALVRGNFAQGRDGGALGLLYQQQDVLLPGLNNALLLQASTGHASISGKFFGLDRDGVAQGGARQRRILDVLDFQRGRWGGQALIGYQTLQPDQGPKLRDFSLGARLSYALAPRWKLLTELATTQRRVEGEPRRRLHKGTLALAFAPHGGFWSRPELRLYATRANWNEAAALAAAGSYGFGGRRQATTVGLQVELWWD